MLPLSFVMVVFPPVAWLYSSSDSLAWELESLLAEEKTLLTALSMAAIPSVEVAAEVEAFCFPFSDSIGLFAFLFFDIKFCEICPPSKLVGKFDFVVGKVVFGLRDDFYARVIVFTG